MDQKKVLIGMSGGVDSSVAALLMKQAGYSCLGTTMQLYESTDSSASCSAADTLSKRLRSASPDRHAVNTPVCQKRYRP